MSTLCRNCATLHSDPVDKCRSCGASLVVSHEGLARLSIGHIDCDAFFASIEKRDRPELADQPVIIGGGHRGVVSTACYVARRFGVRSAMPAFKARQLCPDGIFLKPDMAKYQKVGHQIRTLMTEAAARIEPISIDEAFLAFDEDDPSPASVRLAELVIKIRAETGLTVSVGLSGNKFLAKVASDLEKPFGYSVISPEEAPGFLASRPVRLIWGVGEKLGARLAHDGIYRIGQLQKLPRDELLRRYGSIGGRLHALSFGRDNRPVGERSERKSLSSETTFNNDIRSFAELDALLHARAERVAASLTAKRIAGRTVVLKLKTAEFQIVSRHVGLAHPTAKCETILDAARPLLAKLADGTAYRLLGVGVADLCSAEEADPPDLFSWGAQNCPTPL